MRAAGARGAPWVGEPAAASPSHGLAQEGSASRAQSPPPSGARRRRRRTFAETPMET